MTDDYVKVYFPFVGMSSISAQSCSVKYFFVLLILKPWLLNLKWRLLNLIFGKWAYALS